MNLKKGLLRSIVMGAVLIGAISINSHVQATQDGTEMLLKMNIPTYRASGYTYQAGLRSSQGTKIQGMWKIYRYNDNGQTIINENNAIYCLKMGVGFGSAGGSATQSRTYDVYADMKDPEENDVNIINSYKATLPDEANYNAILWILDHAYVPARSNQPTTQMQTEAQQRKEALLTAAQISTNSKLNDDLIDIVQQLAIWYFSNDDEYKATAITGVDAMRLNGDWDDIDTVFNGDLKDDFDKLYAYFITGGNNNKTSTISTSNPITLDSSRAKTELDGTYYISGPYKIENTGNSEYILTAELTSQSGSDIPYTILDSNKQPTSSTLKEIVGNDFYLRIESTQDVDNSEFALYTTMKQNDITYWTVSNPNNDQPVAQIEPIKVTHQRTINLTLSEFDLALRKFITKINDVDIQTSREPLLNEETRTLLSNNEIKTATKTHTKTPLEVTTGSTVLYTIRIYNEGNVDGYASQVTDYLPAGLTLKENSTINTENGWTNPSGDGKTIVTTKLENELIDKLEGTTVSYKDLQIECVVTAVTEQNSQSLKNVAEITAHKDENGNTTVVDRDSTPNNLTETQKNTYNPGESEQGWGYEDDDDYEELVLPGKYFDLALRKFITKINNLPVDIDRTPIVSDETKAELANKTVKTATKTHTKAALRVATNDTVLYTIRVYNEGEISGYASQVTDYLPVGLELKENSTINEENGWTNPSGDKRTIVTTKLANTLINAFDGRTLDYNDLEVECVVKAVTTAQNQSLKNIAEITAALDQDRNEVIDRDSTTSNLTDEQKSDYKPTPYPTRSEQGEGYEDDDDYEEIILPGRYFDLALRKFITKINNTDVQVSRNPVTTEQNLSELYSGETQTAIKAHTKAPLSVKIGDTVLYTIRIYNEGEIDGYASEITDYLPAGLILKENSTINEEYGWTNPSGDGKTIVTTKLANTKINKVDGTTLDYKDVLVECTVSVEESQATQSLKNIAEITKALDENKNEVTDRDSTPKDLTNDQKTNYNPTTSEQGKGYEDDDDYEEIVITGKVFDLSLRKFVTNINGKELVDKDGKYLREPKIDVTPLNDLTGTTAIYKHAKNPVGVALNDIVIYTIRIYNEGELDGYASKVTDYLPEQLEFVIDDEENFNASYGWQIDSSLRKASTTILAKQTIDPEDTLIKAFDGEELDYQELKIKCRVKSTIDLDKVITNIAEVTDFTDSKENKVIDRDSAKSNIVLPEDKNLPDYKGNESNKSVLTDKDYFYKGQEDDDDFEKLILEQFDLALRKFITKVNETPITNRIPKFTNVKNAKGNYIYEHTKEPIEVQSTDIVEYTLRIYNEGDIAGYAKEVKDDIPQGLEFIPQNETNKEYRWKMLDEQGNETQDTSKAVSIVTDYLSKEQENETDRENLIEAFDNTKQSPDYKDVKVAFKVVALDTYEGIITNIAQISDDSDENGNEVEDKDSTPNNDKKEEDDQDEEKIKLKYFDLALRKFITAVNENEVTNRVPVFKITEDGEYVYEHTKEPIEVENGNIVTYTLRIYNEGTMAGYAKEVKDDLPEGLEFIKENETNREYRWKMLDEQGNETQEVSKAVAITTDYLSKEQEDETSRNNLLKAFNVNTMEEPDFKEVKIAFKVTEPNTSDRILINKAQISDDSDENGNEVIDKDSTPDKWNEGEDDQDIEKVKVKYFDLALRKWVTQAIVIDNGKQTITETGHKAEDDPEAPVKVEIKEGRLNKVVVKFCYKIRVTNQGEIAGYVKEISDYIPEGLKFVAADNPTWKQVDGKITTDALKDTLLQPGESAQVEVLLTWINGKNNFGLKTNIAEISKDENESNTPDIDSTPNNKVPQEDDIDDAPVILTIKTGAGENMQYIVLVTISLTIIATGVIFIKKFVL